MQQAVHGVPGAFGVLDTALVPPRPRLSAARSPLAVSAGAITRVVYIWLVSKKNLFIFIIFALCL